MSTQENIVLTPAQYNELSSFVDNAKLNLEKINSFLSSFKLNDVNVNVNENNNVNVDSKVTEIVKRNEQANIDYDSTNPSIKSEKQWFICNNDPESETGSNWISNRKKLLSQFDLNVNDFLKLLEKTQAVVAGGFAVNCLFSFDLKNYNGDMDIFLTDKFWKKDGDDDDIKQFINYLCIEGCSITLDVNTKTSDLSEHYGVNQECPKDKQKSARIVEAYKSLNKISRMVVFSKTVNGVKKDIQVIFTEYDCVRSHIRTFDMSICQTFFDHKQLYTRFKYHLLTLNRVNMLLKKDVDVYEDIKYLKRIYKYKSRGFKTYFDIEQSPFNQNYNCHSLKGVVPLKNTDKYINLEGAEYLLEWKNESQDDKDCPVISLKSLHSKKILYYVRVKPTATLVVNDICKISYNNYINDFPIAFENKENNFYLQQLVYLVDSDYNILFLEESLLKHINLFKPNSEELVKDPVEYLENKIEKNIKKIMSVYNINNNGNNADSTFPLTLYAKNLFVLLRNPLQLFKNTDRIGNPFKHKYTEIFNTYVDILQENILFLKETNTDYSNIQTTIQLTFMNYIFENIKDIRWLLSLMIVYPDLFKFTEAHYKAAIINDVARDNLYIIKKELKEKN